jgi:hypothetical protein
MRGAMLVSICLAIFCGFTPFWRRFFMFAMLIFYFFNGEFIAPFSFFLGANLAEIANVQAAREKAQPVQVATNAGDVPKWRKLLGDNWALGLFFVSWFFVTQAPEGHERAQYAYRIYLFVRERLTPTGGIFIPNPLPPIPLVSAPVAFSDSFPFFIFISPPSKSNLVTRVLITASPERVLGALSACGMIFSIMFSPQLKKFFSRPLFVWLGSISFPLYLLHGTFIRGPLAYIVLKVLPRLPWIVSEIPTTTASGNPGPVISAATNPADWYTNMQCNYFACVVTAWTTYIIWFGCVLFVCKLWGKYVDVYGVRMSSWFEQVATGKKGFLESSGIANWRLVRLVERVGGKGKGTVFVDKYGYDGEKMALAAQGV